MKENRYRIHLNIEGDKVTLFPLTYSFNDLKNWFRMSDINDVETVEDIANILSVWNEGYRSKYVIEDINRGLYILINWNNEEGVRYEKRL